MIIGMCGKAGSGKDTIADYLVSYYGFKKLALADPIKRLVKDVFALDDHTVYDRIAREQPLKKWPPWTVRKLLQFIGTELFRNQIDDSIWVKSLWYKIHDDFSNNYVITDVRFNNELTYFKENSKKGDFYCLKVIRSGSNGDVGIIGHASEAFDLKGDFEIINDATYDILYSNVDSIMNKIGLKKAPYYGAND